jgi:hypothetical protein
MIVSHRLEFSGGVPETSLMTVEAHQITVTAYHPNRSQLKELSAVSHLVAESMGTDDGPSVALLQKLSRIVPSALTVATNGKEMTHVERN